MIDSVLSAIRLAYPSFGEAGTSEKTFVLYIHHVDFDIALVLVSNSRNLKLNRLCAKYSQATPGIVLKGLCKLYTERCKREFRLNCKLVLNYGPFHRIWPAVGSEETLYASVSAVRSFVRPICKLLESKDFGDSWIELADFHLLNPNNSTTGQPFTSIDGTPVVSLWDENFYEFGRTWLAIYRSEDGGQSWEEAYSDPAATYGNHFFQNSRDGRIYLCAGLGGGGSEGKVSFAPARGLLLRSQDSGRSWNRCLEVDGPTALYDGVAFDDIVVVSARDRGSIFRSEDKGETWREIPFGRSARNVARVGENVVVSSDGALFISSDEGRGWVRKDCPLRNLALRYPTPFQDGIAVTGVGWRSFVLTVDPQRNRWKVILDATRVAHTKLMARMALTKDYLFLGDEAETGTLLKADIDSLRRSATFPYRVLDRLGARKMVNPMLLLSGNQSQP